MTFAELMRIDEQLASERAAARPVVASLRERGAIDWDTNVPASWRTAGMVQELIAAAEGVLESEPSMSRELAHYAIAIASALPNDAYPPLVVAQVEGLAWRQLGTAHRYQSAYAESLRAYERARRAFDRSPALAHDVAIVDLAIAVVFSQQRRHDEATAILDEVEPVFAEFSDHRRVAHCGWLRGAIEQRRGNLAAARTWYEAGIAQARKYDDLHMLATMHLNLGRVCTDLGESAVAASHLQQARELFVALGQDGEVTRVDLALGRLLLSEQRYAEALQFLPRVRDRFAALKMVEEAGLAALDIVDALVATGDRDAARALTDVVVREFTAAHLSNFAVTALAYLRDLLPTHNAPARPIAHVRTYLGSLRDEPQRAFLPLTE